MLAKECRDCGQMKPVAEFWNRKASPDGLALYCKECFGLRNAAAYRGKQAVEGKEVRAYRKRVQLPEGMKYCARCETVKSVDEFGRNRARKSGIAVYCRPCYSVVIAENKRRNHGSERNYLLRLRYGVTEQEVTQMVADQGGTCVICLRAEPKHVDHSHLTGRVRGILCFKCNGALGQFKDDPRCLGDAANYLELRGPHAYRMKLELDVPALDGHARRREVTTLWGTKAKLSGTSRQNHLRQKYGINDEDARWLLNVQGGMCAICWSMPAEHVDHDHRTGAVRGMACGGCNAGMGQLGDDPTSLRRAADYLLGELVREVPASSGTTRLSFTVPDVDPRTVPAGGWEPYLEADGRHRRNVWQDDDDREDPAWVDRCLDKILGSLRSMSEENARA
ncbi:endonuclease VII domain-containing protein [Actinomadura sp. BRA 177]|uniref:endonuclease VII domain-containing protein n=1 Tax=Actinomadura sp. BRA 177 TaxID=2745202 RepID=UPI001596187F|nr:endonuclease VII domain-containing protein [Actinomadura sp. BRA 177]NVI87136.1 endonuclease VII domain-containing protein [Actinomadura sp. BRA 177]